PESERLRDQHDSADHLYGPVRGHLHPFAPSELFKRQAGNGQLCAGGTQRSGQRTVLSSPEIRAIRAPINLQPEVNPVDFRAKDEVTLRKSADLVGENPDVDLSPGKSQVGMMALFLGNRRDAIDEIQPGEEIGKQ